MTESVIVVLLAMFLYAYVKGSYFKALHEAAIERVKTQRFKMRITQLHIDLAHAHSEIGRLQGIIHGDDDDDDWEESDDDDGGLPPGGIHLNGDGDVKVNNELLDIAKKAKASKDDATDYHYKASRN